MKIIINKCYGGFGLSNVAIRRYLELCGKKCYFYKQTKFKHSDGTEQYTLVDKTNRDMFPFVSTKFLGRKTDKTDRNFWFDYREIERTDEILIKVVEELEDKASAEYSRLEIVEIPDDVDWEVEDYDGYESIHEKHRSW